MHARREHRRAFLSKFHAPYFVHIDANEHCSRINRAPALPLIGVEAGRRLVTRNSRRRRGGRSRFCRGASRDADGSEGDDKEQGALLQRLKSLLDGKVEEVRTTTRLTSSPACLVVGANDMGEQMRKIMAAAGQPVPEAKPILEINTEHPLVNKLDSEADEERAKVLASLLFDQAALSAGRPLENPAQFVQELNRLMFEA